MTAIRGGRQAGIDEVLAWLRAMPPLDRERLTRALGEASSRAAIRTVREDAVAELVAGATWSDVSEVTGLSSHVINKLLSARNRRLAQ